MGLSTIVTVGPLETMASFIVLAVLTWPDNTERRRVAEVRRDDSMIGRVKESDSRLSYAAMA